jgi:pfkB family carbohydrate kinase
MAELLPLIDIAICSDDFRPPGCRDEADAVEFIAGPGIRQLAITRGAAPIIYLDNRRRGTVSIERVHPTDTLGAGDIFHGAGAEMRVSVDGRVVWEGDLGPEALVFDGPVAFFSPCGGLRFFRMDSPRISMR